MREDLSEAATNPAFLARLAKAGPHRARIPKRIVLSSYVELMEQDRPLMDTLAPSPEAAQSIING